MAVQPVYVRPLKSESDGMRILLFVGVRVMLSVNRNPSDGIALQRERPHDREQVLERLSQAQTPVREYAMITERDAERARQLRDDCGDRDIRKMEERGHESGERTEMN